jgi:glycine/D-amino acid oxidase-like deaminating enzyme
MSRSSIRYLVVGAGVHGLSTAWHLAGQLKARGAGDGSDILVIDKAHVGAGASGIACGVIRNNYSQPAMRSLMAHSVEIWESDPEAFAYSGVGYLQAAPDVMEAGVVKIAQEQQAIGYPSRLIQGEADCRRYMKALFSDWQAQGITTVLHELRGGFANNRASMDGLADKARSEGVEIRTGVTVTGMTVERGAVTAVETDQGSIACEQLVVAVGPWIRDLWRMLELPERIDVHAPNGGVRADQPMWTYWALQEGTLRVDPGLLVDDEDQPPPVVHVDSDAPLHDDTDGSLITDQLWGIYYKPDPYFGGVQGGAVPQVVPRPAGEVAVDPYGPDSPDFVVGAEFRRIWSSALAHCHKRLQGQGHLMSPEPSGGIGCFTPDSFPIFDALRENAYVIADSNHGYKMIGVGALVAGELLGDRSDLLEPFRLSRYSTGALHPTSTSPFPWS